MRKLALAGAAVAAISSATIAPAEARWGPGIAFGLAAGALAFGAAAAASPYYYGGYYGPGPYGYYGGGPYAYYGTPVYYGPRYYRPYYRPYYRAYYRPYGYW
jgi:hypothetical protein